jgi:NAD(P)H-hydrate repair Nnr-like enzyme with NAD(P)H-hydrate dehydratase domain
LAQGLTLKDAAEAGVDLHAKAADQASLEYGEAGLTSSDVINELRYLLKYD